MLFSGSFVHFYPCARALLSNRNSDKSAKFVGLHLDSVHIQYLSECFVNLLILCASLIFFFDGSGGDYNNNSKRVIVASHTHTHTFFLLSQFSVFIHSMHHTHFIYLLFMYCCPFTNICLLVMFVIYIR